MKYLILFFILFASLLADAQQHWPGITQSAKPWTRWWWMGSAVDSVNIQRQINLLKSAGFGGVEIVPIYGAKGYESRYIKYLSPQWISMLDYTVKTAGDAGMGVYISAGTGWPIGGPQVSMYDAATKLVVQQYPWNINNGFKQKIIGKDSSTLSALLAFKNNQYAGDITGKVAADGTLDWQPSAKGKYTLYALFNGKTGQKVKRAAPGGEGYTLDHFSPIAIKDYLKTFDTAFGNSLHGVQAFYNDSYEVFGADWTPGLFEDFKKLRGYDLKKYIPQFLSEINNDTVARLKSDYRETISDLLLNNFTKQFTAWSHSKKALSLNQAHGSPGNLLDLYAAVDIPECETFGTAHFPIPGLRYDTISANSDPPDPIMLKFASSAAHVSGKNLVSCETFTWLGEHFKSSWAQCKPLVEEVFLAGVNHTFYHGTTYSPAEAAWPGWLFYASLNAVPNNSLWPHINALNSYIARCQAVLQSGKPYSDVAVYWPVYDAWHNASGINMSFTVHNINEWLHPTAFYHTVQDLQQHGYAVDYFSDKMLKGASVINHELVSSGNASYKVLVIPKTGFLPYQTLQRIVSLAENGLTIITPDLQFKQPGLPGLNDDQNKKLFNTLRFTKLHGNMQKAIVGKGKIIIADKVDDALQYLQINGETLPLLGLKFTCRKIQDGKYYYIVNHTNKSIDTLINLQHKAAGVQFLDPQSGKTGWAPFKTIQNTTQVYLQLQPGESVFILLSDTLFNTTPWHYNSNQYKRIELTNAWTLKFKEGGSAIPADTILTHPMLWTTFSDTAYQNFSGTGVYSTSFNIKKAAHVKYELYIDSLYESAKIIVNGKEAGYIWSIPNQLDITPYLHDGENIISIEAANLMANRIRYMDRHKINWKNYHEINFVNIKYKPFDASTWGVAPSGISGVYLRERAVWRKE
ncbi:MAG: glycoside hydrolase [Bacteroidetes bacterium]|nr:glycoside hydrolase [Bacteroidota bacterium]